MLNMLFSFSSSTKIKEILEPDLFLMDPSSGLLQTNATLGRFVDGHFELVLKAANGPDDAEGDYTRLKVRFYSLSSIRLSMDGSDHRLTN